MLAMNYRGPFKVRAAIFGRKRKKEWCFSELQIVCYNNVLLFR